MAAAIAQARSLYRQAKSKHGNDDHTGAFLDARDAWKLVRELDEPTAKSLAAEIYADLHRFAQKASAENGGAPAAGSRTLILK